MAFVVSEGALRALDRIGAPPAYSLRITDNYTQAYAEIWRTQPAVRTVCTFLGRNIAQLGLHVYQRVSDTDRKRLTDHPLAQLLSSPAPWMTRYRLLNALVQDRAIYDAAYWLKFRADGTDSGGVDGLARMAPWRTEPKGKTGMFADEFVYRGDRGERSFPRDQVVHFRGYNPTDDVNGAPPIEALRRILAEEWEASRMREQILRNGARVSGYIHRPAPDNGGKDWGKEARERFARGWKQQYTGGGPETGGTPILEDGMTFVPAAQTATELQYVQVRKLTREEVAAAYHIPPPMVGILDHATFGNIEEQHKMLYMDTLGPWLTEFQEEIELQLLSDFGDTSGVYVEFNLAEKLKGSFEEQAAALQTSVGAPWMTRNEARARQNLPSLEGGDELITPLNVLVGGQASPTDSGTQNELAAPAPAAKAVTAGNVVVHSGPVISRDSTDAPLHIKSGPRDEDAAAAKQTLVRFFKRQRAAVLSAMGAKDPQWWDAKRWDRELSDDLYALSAMVTEEVAAETMKSLGLDPADYSMARTENFLRAIAEARAGAINSTTRDQLVKALAAPEDVDVETSTPAGVFDQAEGSRSDQAAKTLATTLGAVAVAEVGKQINRPKTTKTWLTTSSNPRASHSAVSGETVPIDGTFSNGMTGPGDPTGGVDEVAGCSCVLDITIP
jgi:HK97 family phage portal protein